MQQYFKRYNYQKVIGREEEGNEVSDIEPLRKLTELTHLVLRENKITDYSPEQSYYRRLYYKDFELP